MSLTDTHRKLGVGERLQYGDIYIEGERVIPVIGDVGNIVGEDFPDNVYRPLPDERNAPKLATMPDAPAFTPENWGWPEQPGSKVEVEPEKADFKETNPKDAIGAGKLPLDLLPESASIFDALAMLEGGLKYGAHNYRAIGVRASIYYAACRRHLLKWWNGEWADPKTGVPHLASARCCLGIIMDAMLMEKLTDDRPPANPRLVDLIDASAGDVERLKELFKDCRPKHYTINDGGAK